MTKLYWREPRKGTSMELRYKRVYSTNWPYRVWKCKSCKHKHNNRQWGDGHKCGCCFDFLGRPWL